MKTIKVNTINSQETARILHKIVSEAKPKYGAFRDVCLLCDGKLWEVHQLSSAWDCYIVKCGTLGATYKTRVRMTFGKDLKDALDIIPV